LLVNLANYFVTFILLLSTARNTGQTANVLSTAAREETASLRNTVGPLTRTAAWHTELVG